MIKMRLGRSGVDPMPTLIIPVHSRTTRARGLFIPGFKRAGSAPAMKKSRLAIPSSAPGRSPASGVDSVGKKVVAEQSRLLARRRAHELGRGLDPHPPEVEPVGIPAGADSGIVRMVPIRVP